MTAPVTLLGRTLPAAVERAVHVLDAGRSLSCGGTEWRSVFAVVEHGEIELQTASGGLIRLEEGASFCIPARAASITNTGLGRTVLTTVCRAPTNDVSPAVLPRPTTPPEEFPWT